MAAPLKCLIAEEEGSNAVEYALLVGLIGLAIVVAVSQVGTALSGGFNNIANSVNINVP